MFDSAETTSEFCVDAEIAIRRIRETDLAAEIDGGTGLDVEDLRRIRGVVRQIVILGGGSAGRVEDEELTVGLELENVVRLIEVGSEADEPTAVKSPGNADVPVVLNTLALNESPFGGTSATDCC